MRTSVILVSACLAMLAAEGVLAQEPSPSPGAGTSQPATPHPALLDPTLATATAPEVFRVRVETTKGPFVIEVRRGLAPHGADRFFNLVTIGYYDDCAFFRVLREPRPFMAQVGYHGDPAVTRAWREATIDDDPIAIPNTRGTVTFAMSGAPNSRTTQFFVNYTDNSYLKEYGAFAPFGRVVEGMEVVDSLYAGYGEGAPEGFGPSQRLIQLKGNAFLKEQFPKLDYIRRATIVKE
jgi:peptidyl-prolyl cis-trans isomerase A (cyclophilin A)